ncbi:hypothetical protein ULMA_15260 [Patiriisocius marinus]|uniref:TraB/GumN family protein n=2 Tax=Patiriisocius marinus TaxID=1397112 RepID=A0A5J4J0E3_9FLAO|nr:hypothetical protein ULMA_15260 [Patiriisocius marinus]
MHIKDNRAFQFPDALIPAIKSTNVFALEINPEIVSDALIGTFLNSDYKNAYKEVLSKEEYKKLKERFYEINEVDLDSFPLQHPFMIESMLTKEIDRPNDRRTFLDAFLYSIAYNYDKEITGLEELTDQFPNIEDITDDELRDGVLYLIENDQEEQDKTLEEMTSLYYQGDLKLIQNYIQKYDTNDPVMLSRNNKMVKSMDSIMNTKSLFSAVGAAHLPGDNGVINLLRKKGFTVTQVPATFEKDNSTFELIPKVEKWILHEDRTLGYSLKMPTKGSEIPMGKGKNMITSIDLLSGSEFSYFAFDTSQATYPEGYKIVDELIKNQLLKEHVTLISRKTFKNKGFDVTQVIAKTEGKNNRMQIYYNGRYLYVFNVDGEAKEIESTYVDAFFDSVEVFEPELPAVNWKVHTDKLGAFSIEVPGDTKDISQTTPSPDDPSVEYDLKIFTVLDTEKSIFNLFRYNDQPNGYYLQDESLFKQEFDNYFNQKGTIIGEPTEETIDGNKIINYEVLLSDKYHTRGTIIFRGNRVYLLLSQSLKPGVEVSKDYRYLKSFTLEPFENPTFPETLKIDNSYEISFPSEIVRDSVSEYDNDSEFVFTEILSGLDPTSGGAYLLQKTKLKEFAKSVSKQQYIDDYSEQLMEWGDTLIDSKNVIINNQPAKQLTIFNEITLVRQSLLVLQHNDNLFTLLCYLGEGEIDRSQKFFNTFKILKTKEKFDIAASKTKDIFKDLKSKDSITFSRAAGTFDYYVFDKADNKILLDNLDTNFLDKGEYFGVKYRILDELSTLDMSISAKKIVEFYNKESDNDLKISALSTLGAFTQPASQQLFMELIQTNPPTRTSDSSFDVFEYIPDSAQFLINEENKLISLLDNELYRDKLVRLYSNYILNDSIYSHEIPSFKKKLKEHFIEDSKRYADTLKRKIYPYINYTLVDNYVNIIKAESSKDPISTETLLTLATGQEPKNWVQTTALITAINLNIDIPEKVLIDKLHRLYSRFEVMEALIATDQSKLIPIEYLESTSYCQLGLYNAVGYEYDTYPDKVTYLGDVTVKSTLYHVYNYIMEEEPNEKYLGYSIATKADISNLETSEAIATWEIQKEDWKTQVVESINELNVVKD